MRARIESARAKSRTGRRLTVVLMGTALAVLMLCVANSSAVLPPSGFEGNDGDMTCCTTGTTDWSNVSGVITSPDVPSGSNDNSFTQGTKEDDTGVTIAAGSIPPNKNDLTRSYLATETLPPPP